MKTTSFWFAGIVVACLMMVDTTTQGQCEPFQRLASDGEIFAQWSPSVAISGDVAVFAGGETAYIYRKNGAKWVRETKIEYTGEDHPIGDWFGQSVGIHKDVVVVGVPLDDDNGNLSGSAHVYRFNGTTWALETILLARDGDPGDFFGWWVAIDGDVIIVGADGEDSSGPTSGAAYVFRFNGTTWVEEQKLTASDASTRDVFGAGVAISGNVAIVGAYQAGPDEAGSAYIFRFNGETWVEEAVLRPPPGAVDFIFGHAVDIAGDVVAVLSKTFVPWEGLFFRAYVFRYAGQAWTLEAALSTPAMQVVVDTTRQVAIGDDVLLVGTYESSFTNTEARLFRREGTTWRDSGTVELPSDTEDFFFGVTVAISGETAIVGAQAVSDESPYLPTGSAHMVDLRLCEGCPLDLNGDGNVGIEDLLGLLAAWGPNPGHPTDFDGDGVVGIADFLMLLESWGPCL